MLLRQGMACLPDRGAGKACGTWHAVVSSLQLGYNVRRPDDDPDARDQQKAVCRSAPTEEGEHPQPLVVFPRSEFLRDERCMAADDYFIWAAAADYDPGMTGDSGDDQVQL